MQCLSCAYENPEAQKFCGECGAPLRPAVASERLPLPASYTPPHLAQRILTLRSALEGERKLVTVLFCDIASSTLQRYAQAIAALAEVKAEYALGVACRQRAHLHKQLGRLDQAGADLTQARHCFAAVGAAVEQADVEQEAITLGVSDGSA